MFDEDYSGESQGIRIIPAIIVAFITTIIVAGVVIPLTVDMTYETVSNSDPSGVFMDYDDSGEVSKSYTLTLTDNKLKIAGSYNGTVDAVNQIVILTDKLCIYVKDNQLRLYRNNTDSILASGTVVNVANGTVYGTEYDWAYIPVEHGEYSSFATIDYITSEKVGFRIGADRGIVEDWDTYELNEKNVIGYVIKK